MTKEDGDKIIGQTLVGAEIEETADVDRVVLIFSNGAKLTVGMGCGSTCEDFPYFYCYIE